jgi:hypothetical protein
VSLSQQVLACSECLSCIRRVGALFYNEYNEQVTAQQDGCAVTDATSGGLPSRHTGAGHFQDRHLHQSGLRRTRGVTDVPVALLVGTCATLAQRCQDVICRLSSYRGVL